MSEGSKDIRLRSGIYWLREIANGFDALAYEKLFDRLIANNVSINDATNEITKLLS